MKNEIILASAGSGKTYRLSNRIITLLLDGADPKKVIALTFTRKAAGEFTAALFEKIAEAASSAEKAAVLCEDLGREGQYEQVDFLKLLKGVVAVLPYLYLGTLDSFFTRVVQAFQFELGLSAGNGLTLVEGTELDELRDGVISEILFGGEERRDADFFQSFKQASLGKEKVGVQNELKEFITKWHERYLTTEGGGVWGDLQGVVGEEQLRPWSADTGAQCLQLIEDALRPHAEGNKTLTDALRKLGEILPKFSGGSGVLDEFPNGLKTAIPLAKSLLAGEEVEVTFRKKVKLTPSQAQKLGAAIQVICYEELRVKGVHTEAIHAVVKQYEAVYHERVREKGKISFADLTHLLGKWQQNEEERVKRELMDYRLDAERDHWLLDEFQDTSRNQYAGLSPLLDEVAMSTSAERSLFVVGDKKQAIYQWRDGDPSLFGEMADLYGIEPDTMANSWRSQPAVLELVNTICGNRRVMEECFGREAVKQWEWQDHVSAPRLRVKPAYSEVRVMDGEERESHLISLLKEVQPTQRGISCALLVRNRADIKRYADILRQHGFSVAEEGSVSPMLDNPVGLLLQDVLKWLLNPRDQFALAHLRISPLLRSFPALLEDAATLWKEWNRLYTLQGVVPLVEWVMAGVKGLVSEFGRDRYAYILEQIRGFRGTLIQLVRYLEELEVSLAESADVIQVMTVHKSKGLGFDMVILPELPKITAANGQYFDFMTLPGLSEEGRKDSFLCTPPSAVHPFFPELVVAKEEWSKQQYYEAFCVLYVALTRSKRGLYCFLETPRNTKSPRKLDNLTQWVLNAVGDIDAVTDEGGGEVWFRAGDVAWFTAEELVPRAEPKPVVRKMELSLKRGRSVGGAKGGAQTSFSHQGSKAGRLKGVAIHEALERVEWLPVPPALFTGHEYEEELNAVLAEPQVAEVFTKGGEAGEEVALYREQTVEWIDEKGLWNTARIDRLHVYKVEGQVQRLELIDYKTDAVKNPVELKTLYGAQMNHYCAALVSLYGAVVPLTVILVSVAHKRVVRWEAPERA